MAKKIETVDQYFATLNPDQKKALQKMRETILSAAPNAEEYISYQMPAFKLDGPLLYIGAFKDHCSLFPGNSTLINDQFAKEVKGYITSKGTIQFPLGKPVPVTLIKKIVKTRVQDNRAKAEAKKNGTKTQ